MVLTLGIHSRMGTVRGTSVIGVCLSPLQGGGCIWCFLDTGEGVCVGGCTQRSRGKSQKPEWAGGRWGKKKTGGGGGLVFSVFPKRIKIGIRFLRG